MTDTAKTTKRPPVDVDFLTKIEATHAALPVNASTERSERRIKAEKFIRAMRADGNAFKIPAKTDKEAASRVGFLGRVARDMQPRLTVKQGTFDATAGFVLIQVTDGRKPRATKSETK